MPGPVQGLKLSVELKVLTIIGPHTLLWVHYIFESDKSSDKIQGRWYAWRINSLRTCFSLGGHSTWLVAFTTAMSRSCTTDCSCRQIREPALIISKTINNNASTCVSAWNGSTYSGINSDDFFPKIVQVVEWIPCSRCWLWQGRLWSSLWWSQAPCESSSTHWPSILTRLLNLSWCCPSPHAAANLMSYINPTVIMCGLSTDFAMRVMNFILWHDLIWRVSLVSFRLGYGK